MRRATAILLCLFLIVNIVLPVSAATSITESRMNASVATDGTCIPSIRQKVFYEGINDMRALQALQKRIGRKATLELVTKYYAPIDFSVGAESEEKLLAFRDEVNQTIAAAVKK